MTKGQVLMAGPTVLPDTLDTDITKSPRQGLHTGYGFGTTPCRGCNSYWNLILQ